ncbi:extracellular superoxide dismutase [Cu-Zn]-like [Pseudoliparis swirei]|uniref:extracellular superoxide dismutase [Cu-Zn]-like n=1 Tax=Pseudoliparis swirei TaxID=2059687 RepID=UPI0024BDA82E|nr:extracellular superoxide dismutase [Cu-Zn]-like [Pseudoliparis swirei]
MLLHGSMFVLGSALLVQLAGCQQCVSTDTPAPPEVCRYNGTLYAACTMKPSTSQTEGLPKMYGQVLLKQDYPHGKLNVLLQFNGFPTEGDPELRALHIHQYGDLSQGCDSTGGHYNPHGENHPNHPGDLGNFEPHEGKIHTMIESEATLFTELSVIGRAMVVHEKMDDLGRGGDGGSLLHGNAGRRLGCCIIGISPPEPWIMNYKLYTRRLRRN